MKVISGSLKGRNIKGYNIEGTRPTMDRVRESIFGTIQNYVKDSIVLDLFAGSGSLGIEALSNGARYCYFVDNNKEVIKVLKDNISTFNITKTSNIIQEDYKQALNHFKDKNIKFDLIFLDPPYKYQVIEEIINYITEYDLLSKNGLIICEFQLDKLQEKYEDLTLIKSKKYSDKYVYIFKK